MICSEFRSPKELLRGFHDALRTRENTLLRYADERDVVADFARSVGDGLNRPSKRLDSRFLYDARGSDLFEQICTQPEYYLTNTEDSILQEYCTDIAQDTGPVRLMELGSGSSTKTEHLLSAFADTADQGSSYVPVDISKSALEEAGQTIAERRPHVQVVGVNSPYEVAFPLFSAASPAMVVFLGSSIGNFTHVQSDGFLRQVASSMRPSDFFLLGIDLAKDPEIIEAAYNDAAGVTAEFSCNLISRMNRDLGSGVELDDIEHVARYNRDKRQIETHLVFHKSQRVDIRPLEKNYQIEAGERILIEISRKFDLDEMPAYLGQFGLSVRRVFTDPHEWFAVLLLQRVSQSNGRGI